MRAFKIMIPLLCLFIFINGDFSQAGHVENGITWLNANQHPDGFWGGEVMAITTFYHSTSVAAETFQYLHIADGSLTNAIAWLSAQDIPTVDHLSRQIEVLAQAGIDVTEKVNTLRSYLQPNGGWGIDANGTSDVLDTALVLRALKAANYSDQNIISSALGFLLSTQNHDGGWGFYPSACSNCEADPSNVYMTAMVLQTLSQYRTIYNLETAINNGVAYLLTKQNPDGGFGTSPSTVYETALAFLALVESGGNISSVAPQVINYLTSTQLPNGSWNDDPYPTALALRALANVKPNLSITPTDITFSNPNPKVGDTITVTATIRNEGPTAADNIVEIGRAHV